MPVSTTLDHVTIITDEFEASRPVYDAVLAAAGLTPTVDYSDPEGDEQADHDSVGAVGYTTEAGAVVLVLAAGAVPTSGAHCALRVGDRDSVQAVADAARAIGARVVQAPREWEARQLGYYGVQVADLNGNLIEVLYRGHTGD